MEKTDIITLKEFIARFSHNNPVWIENKENYTMYHQYRADLEKEDGTVMDWELRHTDIADCNVIRIASVLRKRESEAFTIVVDSDAECFHYVPEKVSIDNSPLWLYEKVHNAACGACCGDV